MKAQAMTAFGAPLEPMELAPQKPGPGEALVRVTRAGLCHSDLHIHDGYFDFGDVRQPVAINMPAVLGHEIEGEIAELGEGADAPPVGTRVAVYPWLGCNACETCRAGDQHLCIALPRRALGVAQWGGMAEYVHVPFASALLEVISGPDAGTVYPIVGDVVDIGSDAANSLRLRDPLISAHHARVLRAASLGHLVDLDSRYGTFVNREPIAISPLGHGDVVQLGTTVLRLSETEDAARETRVAGAGLRDQDVFLLPRVIAHEIKNYLTVLDKSAQELAAAVPAGSGLTANIQRVQLVREHIAELIPMLRVSSMDLSPEPVDVSQLVCEQLTLFERLLSDSLIDSKLDLANKAVAVCDRQRIAHVIMNLIKNAIEAMPHGGKLTVSVRAVNDGVALSFTDTGTGMTPDVAACVFEPLFTTKSGGSGLGLYLVKDLIARHQGTITFNSTPGAGTEFLVWLPRRGYRL